MFTPRIEHRAKQRYVAIRERAPREALADVIPRLLSDVYRRLEALAITAAGGPLVRYRVVDYGRNTVEIDVGVPVVASTALDHGRVRSGVIPGGTFATVIHRGSYTRLAETTAKLLAWGKHKRLRWQVRAGSGVTSWRGRVEHYLTGPPSESKPRHWKTEIAILLAQPRGLAVKRYHTTSSKGS